MADNKHHWNEIGKNYRKNWESLSESILSEKELGFLRDNFNSNKKSILDIGCGTGRILGEIVKISSSDSEIYAVDYAKAMVDCCLEKFSNENKIKKIEQLDISKDCIFPELLFDFVSSIRVLKYNNNWKDVILKIKDSMNIDGVFVFSMPNRHSISLFSNYGMPIYFTTIGDMKTFLQENGLLLEEALAFSRIPREIYLLFPNSVLYAKFISFSEFILNFVFGKTFLGKELFFVIRKK